MNKISNALLWGIVGIITGLLLGDLLRLKYKNKLFVIILLGICGLVRGYYNKDIFTLLSS